MKIWISGMVIGMFLSLGWSLILDNELTKCEKENAGLVTHMNAMHKQMMKDMTK